MATDLLTALIDDALACPCDTRDGPLCARCECLMLLVEAIDIWTYEQVTGERWEVVLSRREAGYTVLRRSGLGGLRGLGYTLLGLSVQAYAVAHYLCWTLPRCAWLTYTGQIPSPADPSRFSETDVGKDGKF